jgi:hypothetical protein
MDHGNNRADGGCVRHCDQCGAEIRGSGVGTGVLAEGLFCGLDCFAARYESAIRERKRAELDSGVDN